MERNKTGQKLSDKELIQGCLENNRLMQRSLFEQYKVALYTISYRLLNDHEAANDAIQDSFIEIFGSLRNFRYKSSLYTWMRTIVVRRCIAKIREKTKLHIVDTQLPETATNDNYNFSAEHLEQAILSLPENARAVFILIEVEGYKHREVATMLNINEGTSKSQLNYAKKLLRQKLSPIANEKRI